jgi:hypothetical protein
MTCRAARPVIIEARHVAGLQRVSAISPAGEEMVAHSLRGDSAVARDVPGLRAHVAAGTVYLFVVLRRCRIILIAMQKYRVMIHGQNLLTKVDDVPQRCGFYTNVFVEAFTPGDAGVRAIDLLHEDAPLRKITLNTDDDPLRFSADEVHEIESFDGVRLPRQGLSLYLSKPDDS